MYSVKKVFKKLNRSSIVKIMLSSAFLASLVVLQGCSTLFDKGPKTTSFDLEAVIGLENIVPIAVIGSGPAGLGAAVYGMRGAAQVVVFEGPNPGGLLMKTTDVANWSGEISIMGPDIIKKMNTQATTLGAYFLADTVVDLDCSVWPYVITTDNNLTFRALTVIIATGASPRLLKVPGEQDYWGDGVTTCAICDAPFYKGEDVVVIGGGDSAVEEALQVAQWVRHVTILVRGDHMRAAPTMQKRLKDYPSIEVVYNTSVTEIVGESSCGNDAKDGKDAVTSVDGLPECSWRHVTGVKIVNSSTKQEALLPTRAVFLAIGHDPNSEIFKKSVACDEHGYIVLTGAQGRAQATSQAGVFAAGDVEDRVYRQAGVAAINGNKAALDALAFLSAIGFSTEYAQKLNLWRPDGHKGRAATIGSLESLAQFEAMLKEEKRPVVLDFYTQNCPGCKQLDPIFAGIVEQFGDRVRFFKVDAGVCGDLAEKFFIYKVPSILIFKDGNLLARYAPRGDQTGAMQKTELTDLVEQAVRE